MNPELNNQIILARLLGWSQSSIDLAIECSDIFDELLDLHWGESKKDQELTARLEDIEKCEKEFRGDLPIPCFQTIHEIEIKLSAEDLRSMRDELCKILGCAWYQSALVMQASAEEKMAAIVNMVAKKKEELA